MTQRLYLHDVTTDFPLLPRPFVALPASPSRLAMCTDGMPRPARCALRSLHLSELTFAFEVSTDEEIVHLRLLSNLPAIDLGTRAHNYLLLTLARRRLQDVKDGLSERCAGWVHLNEWGHDESFQPPQLNIYVHRIRKLFAAHGIHGAYDVIERRGRQKQIRLGVARAGIDRF
jgi:hypothetical protein